MDCFWIDSGDSVSFKFFVSLILCSATLVPSAAVIHQGWYLREGEEEKSATYNNWL